MLSSNVLSCGETSLLNLVLNYQHEDTRVVSSGLAPLSFRIFIRFVVFLVIHCFATFGNTLLHKYDSKITID